MREIKFKAFHKNKKEMYKVFSFCNEFIKVVTDIDLVEKFTIDDFEPLMQYTGLKDKNGAEIYEGDIIQFQSTEGQGLIKKVWFCDKKCSLMIGNLTYENLTESGFFQPSELIFELIGNIYENPELLNI